MRRRPPGRAMWCCSPPLLPLSTISGISKRGATLFAPPSRRWTDMADADMDVRKEAMSASSSSPPPHFVRPRRSDTLPRDRTPLGLWFWEIDRVLLLLISSLLCIGLVAVAAASPVASQKLSTNQVELDPLYYFYRQLLWVGVGVPIKIGRAHV